MTNPTDKLPLYKNPVFTHLDRSNLTGLRERPLAEVMQAGAELIETVLEHNKLSSNSKHNLIKEICEKMRWRAMKDD